MNSNDKMLDKFIDFEEVLEENQKTTLEQQKALMEASINNVLEQQKELKAMIHNLSLSGISIPTETVSENPLSDADLDNILAQAEIPLHEEEIGDVISFEEVAVEEEIPVELPIEEEVIEEEISVELPIEEVVIEEETIEEEIPVEAAVEEEKPPMPDLSDPNKMMTPEDIAALLANL